MADIAKVYEAILFLEDHLRESVTVMDVASFAGYSLFHFSRSFHEATGHNPYDYLIRRRLSEAASRLLEEKERLTDIAFEYQFNSLETFSRAFKRMFGVTPNRFRAGSHPEISVLKAVSTLEYLIHINRNGFFKPSLTQTGKQFLLGEVHDILGATSRRQADAPAPCVLVYGPYGSAGNPLRLPFRQAGSLEDIPDHSVGKTLPEMTCVRFNHFTGDMHHTYAYIFQTWLPLSVYSRCTPYSIEYPHQAACPGDGNSRTMILIPVKKSETSGKAE